MSDMQDQHWGSFMTGNNVASPEAQQKSGMQTQANQDSGFSSGIQSGSGPGTTTEVGAPPGQVSPQVNLSPQASAVPGTADGAVASAASANAHNTTHQVNTLHYITHRSVITS